MAKHFFKENDLVWVKSLKTKGRIKVINRDMGKTYLVEIIVNFNKETGERTTKLEKVKAEDLTPYKKPKRKQTKKYNPNEMYYMVREFHKAFGHHVADKPTVLSKETVLNRNIWTGEELVELLYATVNGDENEFEELYELFKRGLDKSFNRIKEQKKPVNDILTAQADALTDQLYFIFGSFVQMGVKPFNLFKIVQRANMGKLWNINGKLIPQYREEDGKIKKPPMWEEKYAPEPRLKAEIERQSR